MSFSTKQETPEGHIVLVQPFEGLQTMFGSMKSILRAKIADMSRYNIPISRSQPHMGVYLDSEDDTYYWFREAVPDQGTSVRQTVAKGNAHATGRPSNSRRYDQQGAHGFQYSASPSRDQPPPLTSVHVPSTTRGNEQQQVITLLRSECVHDLYFIEANFKDSGENQPFLLALDTGARDSWIYGRSCKALPPPDNDGIFQYGKNVKPAVDWYQVPQRNPLDEKPVHNKFDLNKDTHRAVRGTVPTLMIYADGTAVELGLVKTTITLLPWGAHAAESALRNPLLGYRPIVIEDFHIGVARAASSKIAQKKFHGILGLAPSTQRSIFDGKNDKIVISSIIERLKGNKAANKCAYYIRLLQTNEVGTSPFERKRSFIQFGGNDWPFKLPTGDLYLRWNLRGMPVMVEDISPLDPARMKGWGVGFIGMMFYRPDGTWTDPVYLNPPENVVPGTILSNDAAEEAFLIDSGSVHTILPDQYFDKVLEVLYEGMTMPRDASSWIPFKWTSDKSLVTSLLFRYTNNKGERAVLQMPVASYRFLAFPESVFSPNICPGGALASTFFRAASIPNMPCKGIFGLNFFYSLYLGFHHNIESRYVSMYPQLHRQQDEIPQLQFPDLYCQALENESK